MGKSASSKSMTEGYDDARAIEFERLEASSFKPDFFEKMQEINYDRYIDGEKFKLAEFYEGLN